MVLNNIGFAYNLLDQNSKAMEFLQQGLAITRQVGDRANEGRSLTNIGDILYQSGKLVEAEKILRTAISIQESLRSGLSDANKVSIFDTQTHSYILLQKVLIAQNETNAALEISERGRARAFV